jgi:pulcherriminic acid synthase
VYDEAFGAWLISRYADVRAALTDPRLVTPGERPLGHAEGAEALLHSALREGALTAGIGRVAHVLASRLSARQEADLVTEFCQWLPAAAVVVALGLPGEATARVRDWCMRGADASHVSAAVHGGWTDTGSPGRGGLREAPGAPGGAPGIPGAPWDALLRPLVARRRTHPRADLLSVLCTARIDGRPLSDATVTGLAGTLLDAAAGTGHALASFLANLLDHPGQLELIRARPAFISGAWAESLRRDPPLHIVLRRAVEPVGAIPAGATVVCLPGAAGRDPARFTDPDRYDAFRSDAEDLAYGAFRSDAEDLAYGAFRSDAEGPAYGVFRAGAEEPAYGAFRAGAEDPAYGTLPAGPGASAYTPLRARPGDPGAELARRTAEHGLCALLAALPQLRWAPGFRPRPEGLVSRSPRALLVRLR